MCLQPRPHYVSLPPGIRPLYGRLAWLDELRLIAILAMVLDHTLLFFGRGLQGAELVRLTLTRCAEPLFVLVLTFLTIYLGRAMRPIRWLQIVAVSIVTSAALSNHLGDPIADILTSIALAALVLPMLVKLCDSIALWVVYLSSGLACLPVEVAGVGFDYSPVLLVYQIMLAVLLARHGMARALGHGVVSGLIVVASSFGFSRLGVEVNASLIVVIFGHPLAAIIVHALRRQEECYSTPLTRLAQRPLTLYAAHVCLFAWVAQMLSNAAR